MLSQPNNYNLLRIIIWNFIVCEYFFYVAHQLITKIRLYISLMNNNVYTLKINLRKEEKLHNHTVSHPPRSSSRNA